MSTAAPLMPSLRGPRAWARALPFYYGWINVVFASLAMTATLPGRTHGLGLITEDLLDSLRIDHLTFSHINLASSIIGAAFCLPIGWLIDRFGSRIVLTIVTAGLGISVIAMSEITSAASLLVDLTLVRGLGQSALSVVSLAVIGKWFRRRLGVAMGVFSVLLTFGFIGSVVWLGLAVKAEGWRLPWQNLGWAILVLAPLYALFVHSTPESCGIKPDEALPEQTNERQTRDFTLGEALRTPAFWIVTLGSGLFIFVWSGVTLFNESILTERGFDTGFSVHVMMILTGVGLLANLLAGAVISRKRVLKLLGVALMLLAAALVALPSVDGAAGARLYALAVGLSGGAITVIFFAAFGQLFGRVQLGRIQGGAQFISVLASALGPVAFARGQRWTGDYTATFYVLAGLSLIVAIASFVTPLPRDHQSAKA